MMEHSFLLAVLGVAIEGYLMTITEALAPHLPYLRRYARALTGSQSSGDAYVRAALTALLAGKSDLARDLPPRVALYRLFTKIWNSVAVNDNRATEGVLPGEQKLAHITPLPRQAFLLVALEGYEKKVEEAKGDKKAAEKAAMIAPQIADDEAPANYYRALKDVAAWMPKNAFLSAEGAGTMDIGLTQLPSFSARSCLNAGTYGTMGVGLGQAIAACIVHPDQPVIHLSGDSAIGFSGMEMETLVRYNLPAKIVVLNNGGIGPGMPQIPENPMFNLKPNALIWGARYDRVMEAFGGKGFLVEDPKDLRGALDEAMNFRGPALVNVVISQGSARKTQEFGWHS